MRRKLVITGGGRERELQLVGRIVVGRDPACEISHDDSLLSRRHAEFLTVGEKVTVRDLGSRNGVFVNGARAVEQALQPGDVVQIGPLRAQFVIEEAPLGISPEEIDGDRTAIIRKAFASPGADQERPLAVATATVGGDDDDVTRMIPAPRMPAPGSSLMDGSPAAADDGDAPTAFIPAASVFSPEPPRVQAAAAATVAVSRAGIFFQVLALVMVALATAIVPVSMGAAPVWLAVPVLVAFGGSYLVAASIHRRATAADGAGAPKRT